MIRKLIKLWPELWALPFTVLVLMISPLILRWVDPTSATYDGGIWQMFLYPACALLIANVLAFMGVKLNFPAVYSFYKSINISFKGLTLWQKFCFLFALYFSYLLIFALLVMAMPA